MAKETLAVPEESILAVIAVIRAGLAVVSVPDDLRDHLTRWCDEEESYIVRIYRDDDSPPFLSSD